MNRADALLKVTKLMRMSKSANANEAATALRMAQKLMEEHAIDAVELDAEGLEPIVEQHGVTRRGRNWPLYRSALANLLCKAFGLTYFWYLESSSHELRFIGPRSRAAVATYCYTVLLRQLERDRRKFLSRVRKAKNRAARGDVFGTGWVSGAASKLQSFAGTDDSERINRFVSDNFGELTERTAAARKSKAVSNNDIYAGHHAGRSAQLDRGVNGNSQVQLEHQS